MGMTFKYRGRSFSSAKSMISSMQRDAQNEIERKLRQTASSAGLSSSKTSRGLEFKGSADQMARFYQRLGK